VKTHCFRFVAAIGLSLAVVGSASAQPKLVSTGIGSGGLTADGNTASGLIFVSDLELTEAGSYYRPYKFTRGVGFQSMGDRPMQSAPQLSADGQAACGVIYNNPENWSNFETLYPYGPLPTIKGHTLTGRWTAPGGWVNEGSFPNVGGFGAARCDQPLNGPADISGDGRFIVGWAHYGTFGSVDCKFYPAIFDSTLGVGTGWSRMPFRNNGIQPASLPHTISNDGRFVEGYDMGDAPQPIPGVNPPIQNARSLTVWERTDVNQPFPATSESILDYWGAGSFEGQINGPGTVIAGYLSSPSAQYVTCNTDLAGSLVRYSRTAPSGACCLSSATCVLADPQACEVQGGWYAGHGVACAAAACSSVQYGSCCTTLRGCNITNSARCQCYAGVFVAGGTCSPNPCPGTAPELVACCAGSICRVVDQTFCRAISGQPKTGVTTCSPSPCSTSPWYRTVLGRVAGSAGNMVPSGISDDGNTIIGAVGGAAFIWRPTLNEGVPMLLSDYLTAQNGGNPFPGGDLVIGQLVGSGGGVGDLSADGNAVLVSFIDFRDTCPGTATSHLTGGSGILYLNGSSVPCDPPQIAVGPRNQLVHNVYDLLGTPLNVFASGSVPLNYEWQMAPTPTGPWTTPTESCSDFNPPFDFEGVYKVQLRIGGINHGGYYRVVISNACGSVASEPALIQFAVGACCYTTSGSLVCTVEAQNVCTGSPSVGDLGGTYAGDFTTCMPTPQDPCANSTGMPLTGACCYGSGGSNAACVIDVASHCTLATGSGGYGGSFVGAGTTCSPTACATVSGACCYSQSNTTDVVCTAEVQAFCTRAVSLGGLAGAYISAGSTCTPTACSTVAGACCYAPDSSSGVICTIQTQTRCTNLPQNPSVSGYISGLQGIYVGNGTTCLPVNQQCGFVAGACCYSLDDTSSAICTLQLQDRCTRAKNNNGLGGAYRGDATTCTPTSCTTVTGACCYSTFSDPQNLICTIQPAGRCTARFNAGGLFGTYLGGGTTCGPTSCNASSGACCYTPPNDTCIVCSLQALAIRCTDPVNGGLGGTFAGAGSVCTPLNCIRNEGACCVDTSCTVACATICTDSGGTYRGDGTTCSPDPCNPNPTGACCRGTTCLTDTAANCTGANASFAGLGTVCNTFAGNRTSPCCLADYNHVGGVTVQDIFDFLSAYFTQNTLADINGVGGVTVQDIFDFLSAYFGGCA
jgi:hypothetical protein